MSDLSEISKLVNSYAILLDAGDVGAVSSLFEHADWRSEGGPVLHGSDQVRPVYEQLIAQVSGTRTKHLLTNLTVDVETDATTATAHCYWTVLQTVPPDNGINILLSGQYFDHLEKADGTWRFSERLITVDLGLDGGDQSD